MSNTPPPTRPAFAEALSAWQASLARQGLPAEITWVFSENLCFERDPAKPDAFRIGFQTAFTPPPRDAEQIAYEHFSDIDAPLVFYRLGSCRGKSICALLCDEWFRSKGVGDGFSQREEWRIAFRPGNAGDIEEVADKQRWEQRIIRDRPIHDLDFCMTLRAVHETLAHGRVLTSYERYALRFLHAWGRFLRHQE